MKTNMQQTSLLAYHESALTNIGAKQKEVFQAILRLGKPSDQEIAEYLGWAINRITPRRGELLALGKIKEAGKKINGLNRPVMMWEVVPV